MWEKVTQKMGHECELAVIRSINRTGTSSLNGNEREHSFSVRKPFKAGANAENSFLKMPKLILKKRPSLKKFKHSLRV